MKLRTLIIFVLAIIPLAGFSQSAEGAFHTASNQYIHEKMREAIATLDAALQRYPSDEKLRALREKIKEEEKQKQEQQNQEQQSQEQKEQQNQEQQEKENEQKDQQEQKNEQSEQEKKEAQEKSEQEKKQKEDEQQQKEDRDNQNQNLDREKLDQMKISEEKAKMILEAMKNQEKQYLQQNKRKATKSRDRSKPDW